MYLLGMVTIVLRSSCPPAAHDKPRYSRRVPLTLVALAPLAAYECSKTGGTDMQASSANNKNN